MAGTQCLGCPGYNVAAAEAKQEREKERKRERERQRQRERERERQRQKEKKEKQENDDRAYKFKELELEFKKEEYRMKKLKAEKERKYRMKQETEEREYRKERDRQERMDKKESERLQIQLKEQELLLKHEAYKEKQQQKKEYKQQLEKERMKQFEMQQKHIENEKKAMKEVMNKHTQMMERQQNQHNENIKMNKEQMILMRQQQKQDAIHHKQQLKLQQETEQKLYEQMVHVMDDRKKQQQSFEKREKKIKKILDSKINELKASNIKNQKEYTQKLKILTQSNDKKLEKLEEIRRNDREKYKEEMNEIALQNEENMRKLKVDELRSTLNHEIELISSRLEQYVDKKQRVIEIFSEYKNELFQIGMEERKLFKYFQLENNDLNMLNIVLIGITGHGKSTFANRLAGDKTAKCESGLFHHNSGIHSTTQKITKKIVKNVWNKNLSVIDTPGIFDSGNNDIGHKDRFHTNNLVEFLKGCGGINAFLLVKTRYPPKLDSKSKDVLKSLQILFGREFWKHVIITITHTKGVDAINFDEYAQEFREGIYSDMRLKSDEALLPFIGVDSFDNYKKPIKKLINIIQRKRFKCDRLRSPLQVLKVRNENKKKEFMDGKEELDTIKHTIYLSKKHINDANHLLSETEENYVPKTVNLSFIENENKNEWDINIILPKNDDDNDDNDDDEKKINFVDDNDNDNEEKTKQVNWIAYKEVIYNNYLVDDLSDDEVTVSFTDENFNEIPWKIKLNKFDNKYNSFKDMAEKNEEDDVVVTIIETHYKNNNQENIDEFDEDNTINIKRIIKDMKIKTNY